MSEQLPHILSETSIGNLQIFDSQDLLMCKDESIFSLNESIKMQQNSDLMVALWEFLLSEDSSTRIFDEAQEKINKIINSDGSYPTFDKSTETQLLDNIMKDIIKLQEIESEVGDCDEASQELSKVEARLRSEIDDSSFNSTTQTGEKNIGEILQQSSGKSKEEIFVNLWEAIQGVSLLDGCYRRSSESSPIIQVDNEQQQSLEDSDMEKSECSLDKIVIEIIFRVFASFGQKQCPFEFYVKAAASDSVSKTPDFQLRFIEPSPQNLEFTEPFFKKFASENLLNSSSSEGTHSILSSLRSETDAIRLLHSHPPLKRDSVTLFAKSNSAQFDEKTLLKQQAQHHISTLLKVVHINSPSTQILFDIFQQTQSFISSFLDQFLSLVQLFSDQQSEAC